MRIHNLPRTAIATPIAPTINVETLTTDKQLENSSAEVQDLTNSTITRLNLFLPNAPILGKSFLIINESGSMGNFYLNNSVVYPGDRYEIVWQGSKWLEL